MRKYFLAICMLLCLCAAIMIGKSKLNLSFAHTGTINIVALGDSIAFGIGDPLKKGYIGRLKEAFEQYKRSPIQVRNYGIPKYRTEDVLKQLKVRKIKKSIQQANYIIINIGTNDFRKSAEYQFAHINQRKVAYGQKTFSNNLYQILTQIRNKNESAPIFILGLYQPYQEYENSQQLLELINSWNSEIANAAGQFEHVAFIPVLDLFINRPKSKYFSDSLHLNADGYEKLANRLFSEMISAESAKSEQNLKKYSGNPS